jgi:hypothetical protein
VDTYYSWTFFTSLNFIKRIRAHYYYMKVTTVAKDT